MAGGDSGTISGSESGSDSRYARPREAILTINLMVLMVLKMNLKKKVMKKRVGRRQVNVCKPELEYQFL